MAHVRAFFVFETTTKTLTGDYTLAGAVAGFQQFSDVMSNGDTCTYAVSQYDDATGELIDWETGLGTYNSGPDTLTRTTIKDSSNGGSAVSWGTGTKNIYITQAEDDPMIGSNNGSEFTSASAVRSNIGAVGLSGNNTFTGDQIFTGQIDTRDRLIYDECECAVTALTSGSSVTWNIVNGGMATLTLGHNVTTFTISSFRTGGSYCLRVIQGAGPYAITWPAAVRWPGGQEPTLSQGSGDIDIFTFVSFDGSNLEAFPSLDFG